jgi:MFS transporter, OFA family, oxalate/formate antiporter
MTLWLITRGDPLLFVLLSGLVFLGWGEIFSLFPSTLTDTFGSRNAKRNYCVSTSRRASARSSAAAGVTAARRDWKLGERIFLAVAIAADLTTAALAIAALKPLRTAYLRSR